MSVLHLLGTTGDGGAETYFADLVTALVRAGLTQAAAIRPHAGRRAQLTASDVATEAFRFAGSMDLFTKPRIAGFARRQQAKVLLAWMNRAARHAPAGPWARIGRLGGYYNLKYYRGFDHLVANTDYIAEWVVGQGWPARQVSCIPNFAAPPLDGPPADRAALTTPTDAPLLLAMGRLHEAKAHDVSLRVLTELPDAWLWIAGAGPQEAKLKGMAEALGVAGRVRFLGWRTDASALYRAADVCVFPSRYEPLGNVVIQAWAHRLPVVAAASQGPGALIHDGDDGLLVPVDDAAALAAGVRRLLDEPRLRARTVKAGVRRVEGEFSEGPVIDQWRALFVRYGAG